MENASTKIKITPVKSIVSLEIDAAATPDKSPTVETRLSSTPKIKFRKKEAFTDYPKFIPANPLVSGNENKSAN